MLNALVENIYAYQPFGGGPHFSAGHVGLGPVVRSLLEGGRSDVLWDVMQEDTRPSYGFNMLPTTAHPEGLTTHPERWTLGDSQNHMILLQIEEWFHTGVAGIKQAPDSIAYRELIYKPTPVGDLTHAKGHYTTPQGTARSEWRRNATGITRFDVTVPANTKATVYVPGDERGADVRGDRQRRRPLPALRGRLPGLRRGGRRRDVPAGHERAGHRRRHGAGDAVADARRRRRRSGRSRPAWTARTRRRTTANVISTAGDAALSVARCRADLTNGSFRLQQPLQVRACDAPASWTRRRSSNDAGVDPVQAADRGQRAVADRRLQPDADVHVVHHQPMSQCRRERPALSEARRSLVAAMLQESGAVTITDLQSRFGVSPMTARRDLAILAERGVARRTHGGAVLPSIDSGEHSFRHRLGAAPEAKARLAEAAFALLAPGETVFLDASSTTYFVARLISRARAGAARDHQQPAGAAGARRDSEAEVIAIGGTFRRLTYSFVGPAAVRSVRDHFADRLLMSITGVMPNGVMTDADVLEADVKRTMLEQAEQSVLLLDESKLSARGRQAIAPVALRLARARPGRGRGAAARARRDRAVRSSLTEPEWSVLIESCCFEGEEPQINQQSHRSWNSRTRRSPTARFAPCVTGTSRSAAARSAR